MYRAEVHLVRENSLTFRVNSPADVYTLFRKRALSWPQERFFALHLDTLNHMISYEIITIGVVDASIVHPREVFRAAILANAAAILVAHNHPSGDPTPSPTDRELTRQLVEAGKILSIPVRDHVILGEERYVSFLEMGLIS